jgi:glycosyltransferase involved in cell wall biosynthesis
MRIGYNLIAYLPGSMGGMETYCRNLLSSLQKVDLGNRYSVLCDSHYKHEILLQNPNFQIISCNFSKPSFRWFLRGLIRNTVKIDILTPFINGLEVDVLHHPFSFLNPLHAKIPSVLTFHDMQHEFYPEYFSAFEMKTRRELYRPSPGLATRVIAISEHAKSCLVDRYGIQPGKIDVIYNGFNPSYRILDNPDGLQQIRLKYDLDRPFMYYPAATWPHKNHRKLFAALKIMKDLHRFDGQLVLSGIVKQAHGEILTEIQRLNLEKEVRVLGFLPEADLPWLFNSARLLVFPSLFEGFGIPLVEAMACGCPIVCSNVTSIPEVVGDAGVFFDPSIAEDIAEKIWMLWTDDAMRQEMAKIGLRRAKMFNWEETAKKTVEVYEKAVAG